MWLAAILNWFISKRQNIKVVKETDSAPPIKDDLNHFISELLVIIALLNWFLLRIKRILSVNHPNIVFIRRTQTAQI